jgi:pimeloyl-ACP methyl ester carboxylesterase
MASRRIASLATLAISCALGAGAPAAVAKDGGLRWSDCGDGFQCATAKVPKDYGRPREGTLDIAVIRKPATDTQHRIGSLFVNYGGPGGDGVQTTRDAYAGGLFDSLNDRFDIVSFDPRGTGASEGAIDCRANQETEGIYSKPFPTPLDIDVRAFDRKTRTYVRRCVDLNRGILPYVSTANVARDMDLLREAVGDRKLTYLGFSYGTFLGATYESLFPNRHRALVLDGAVDPDQYINRQEDALREQTAGFERAIGRFLQACAADKVTCPFGGADPWDAYDQLIEQAEAAPLANALAPDRPVNGDDIRNGSIVVLYNKGNWAFLAQALSEAENGGDASLLRFLADLSWGRNDDGTYDPGTDRYFTLSAAEQRYPFSNLGHYLATGAHSWGMFDHFWINSGYSEYNWGLFPVRARDTYDGPFRAPRSGTPTLVVGTTYDPATPYRGAKRAVAELGNARLLTMRGDGHTAYGGNSSCIDAAVDAYFEDLDVPAAGTSCKQEVPFGEAQVQARSRAAKRAAIQYRGPGVKPIAR